MKNIDNIIVDGIYNYFDDGKIRERRKIEVKITEIVPFEYIDKNTLELWKDEVVERDWLYAKETDYFIKGTLLMSDNDTEVIFVRTIDNENGWFSMGWWGGRLDVDGSLTDSLCKNF